ncbi:MAG: tetratricopeptide repeat protein [Xanthomonadales bacterium]|nr:tetratricopeptide repeat protein [Xanthomonadales bacterium]
MSFFNELKRRNVFKVAAAYIIVAWLLLQVSDTLVPALRLPDWFHSGVAFILIMGFPVAMIFAWAYELTPDGLKKEKEVDKSEFDTSTTGQKLNYAIIGLLVLAVAYFSYDKFVRGPSNATTAQTAQATANVAGTPSGTVRAGDRSIAVLPFANRSNVADDLFFTDGIHDDLLTQLAKIDDLKVISRTSVMEYRETTRKIPEIAAELGVSRILEGGVQRAGNRVRINAQLIDVSTDEHLWAETFDREMTVENIFDIQSEIVRQIVTAVRGELSSEESETLAQLPTQNLEAYEAYMHAKAAVNEGAYTAEKYIRAQEWAEQAVSLDPGFSWASALLAEIHAMAVWIGFDATPERVEALKAALDQAVATDPDSAETQAALGEYHYRVEGDYFAALAAFKKASARQPGNARMWYQVAATQRRIGQFDESIESFERAMRLDPANPEVASDYLLTLMFNGDYEKGTPLAEQSIARFPKEDTLRSHLAFMHIHGNGDIVEARRQLDQMRPSAGYEYVSLATRLTLYERDFEAALRVWDLPEVIEFANYQSSPSGWRGRVLGEIHLMLGEHDKATRILNEFVARQRARDVLAPKSRAFSLINVALAYALTDRPEQALEAMTESQAIINSISDRMAGGAIDSLAARILALTGQEEKALQEIERLVDTPASRLTRWSATLDPRWDFFRDNARFIELIRPE